MDEDINEKKGEDKDSFYVEEVVSPVQPVNKSSIVLDAALLLAVLVIFVVVLAYKAIFPTSGPANSEQAGEPGPQLPPPVAVVEETPIPKISSTNTVETYEGDINIVEAKGEPEESQTESVQNTADTSSTVATALTQVDTSIPVLVNTELGIGLLKKGDEKLFIASSSYPHLQVVGASGKTLYEVLALPSWMQDGVEFVATLKTASVTGQVLKTVYNGNTAYELGTSDAQVLVIEKGDLVYYLVDHSESPFDRLVSLP